MFQKEIKPKSTIGHVFVNINPIPNIIVSKDKMQGATYLSIETEGKNSGTLSGSHVNARAELDRNGVIDLIKALVETL